MSKVAALEARESWEAERTGELSKMRWNTGVRRPGSKVSANKNTHTQVSWCWSVLMSAELQTPGPLTWPGAPGNSCSDTAECRKETECPPTSSLPPFPRCSPPPCWQSRPGRSSSLYGSSCEKREGMSREKQRPCQMAVPISFFFFLPGNIMSFGRWRLEKKPTHNTLSKLPLLDFSDLFLHEIGGDSVGAAGDGFELHSLQVHVFGQTPLKHVSCHTHKHQ